MKTPPPFSFDDVVQVLRQHWLRLLPLAIFLLLAMMLAFGLFTPKRATTSPMIGYSLPNFQIGRLEPDRPAFTPILWQGKPVLLNVFASWCEPCKVEHPQLMALANKGIIDIYGIVWRDTPEKARDYINALGNPYQAIGVDALSQMTVMLGITGVPETFLVDGNGVIRWHFSGPLTEDIINTELLPRVASYVQKPAL